MSFRSTIPFLLVALGLPMSSDAQTAPNFVTTIDQASPVMIARSWHGKTPRAKADEYEKYLVGQIAKVTTLKGNLGYEVHRLDNPPAGGDVVEFEVTSFWSSLESIKAFAGNDISRTHDAPRDDEFLIDKEAYVRNYRIISRVSAQSASN